MTQEFYTNVTRKGDNILVRGYKDGKPYQEKIKYEPSIYFKNTSKTDMKTPRGDYLKERKYSSISEARDALKTTKDVYGMESFGTDDWVRQFIRSSFPTQSPVKSLIRTWYWDIETRVDGIALAPSDPISIRIDGEIIETVVGEIYNYGTIPEVFCDDANDYVPIANHSKSAKGFPDLNKADRELMMVTFYDQLNDKIYIFSRKKVRETCQIFTEYGTRVDFKQYDSERTMLKELLMFFKSNRMDFLLGWNSNFDLGFTYNRIKNVLGENLAEHMSPWGYMDVRKKTLDNGDEVTYYNIPGIASMDYLEMYQKFNPGSKESFKLDFIAELEVGEKKVDLPGETFYESYTGAYDVDVMPDESDPHYAIYAKVFTRTQMKRNGDTASAEYKALSDEIEQDHIDLFTYYNLIDTILVKKIDDKQKLVDLCCMIAYGARVNFDQTLSSMMTWESIIYNYFVDNSVMPPVVPNRARPRAFPGAYVMKSVPAKYGWLLSVDATALYPSIMMQNNISPEKKYCMLDGVTVESLLAGHIPEFDRDKYFLSPNGLLTEKGEYGYIPFLVKQKFDERKAYKKRMLECETEAQQIRDELTRRGVSY